MILIKNSEADVLNYAAYILFAIYFFCKIRQFTETTFSDLNCNHFLNTGVVIVNPNFYVHRTLMMMLKTMIYIGILFKSLSSKIFKK
jgi:hypothetical protein